MKNSFLVVLFFISGLGLTACDKSSKKVEETAAEKTDSSAHTHEDGSTHTHKDEDKEKKDP